MGAPSASRISVNSTEFKRTICRFWQEGRCEKGNTCGFAHGEEEIGNPVLGEALPAHAQREHAYQSHVKMPNQTEIKRTICKFWQEGRCDKGVTCGFAHGEHEIGDPVAESSLAPPTFLAAANQLSTPQNSTEMPIHVDVKRTICKFWEEGRCGKGDSCSFAHGVKQLGELVHDGKQIGLRVSGLDQSEVNRFARELKRPLCKFWLEGACSRGDACTFAHDRREIGHSSRVPDIRGRPTKYRRIY